MTVATGGIINIDAGTTTGSLRVRVNGSLIVNGTINVNGELSNGIATTDASTVTVNPGGIINDNGIYQVVATTSPAMTLIYGTFDANAQQIGGTGIFTIKSGGTLITSNASGVNGTLPNSSQTCETGANYVFDLAGDQVTGTKMNADVKDLTFSGSGTKTWSQSTTVNGNLLINSGVTLNGGTGLTHIIKGNWTNNGGSFTASTGTVNFNGSVSQSIGGTSSTTFNNLTIANTGSAGNNTVTLNTATSVSGNLMLTSGILTTTSSNLLSITNTASSAISGGSATSFINGPVTWTLPANLVSGSTYNFPVGKGTTYLPFALVNPTTGTGTVTAQVEAFTANAGGTFDATLSSLSNTEYWSLTTSGDFTNSSVSLNPANSHSSV